MKNIDMGEFSLGKVKLDEDVEYEVCTEEEIDFYDRTIRNNYIKGLHIISNEDMAKVITEYRKQQYSNSKFKKRSLSEREVFMKVESDKNIAMMLAGKQKQK